MALSGGIAIKSATVKLSGSAKRLSYFSALVRRSHRVVEPFCYPELELRYQFPAVVFVYPRKPLYKQPVLRFGTAE